MSEFKTQWIVFFFFIGGYCLLIASALFGISMTYVWYVANPQPSPADALVSSLVSILMLLVGAAGYYGIYVFSIEVPRRIVIKDGTIEFRYLFLTKTVRLKEIAKIRRATGRYYWGLVLSHRYGKTFVQSSMNNFSQFERFIFKATKSSVGRLRK